MNYFCVMEESFELPLTYGGKELLLPAKLMKRGYVYRIELELNGTPVYFEQDEEKNWRAMLDGETSGVHKIDGAMVKAIIEVLQEVSGQ